MKHLIRLSNILFFAAYVLVLLTLITTQTGYGEFAIRVIDTPSDASYLPEGSLIVIEDSQFLRKDDIAAVVAEPNIVTSAKIFMVPNVAGTSASTTYDAFFSAAFATTTHPLSSEQILGRVVVDVPWLGYILNYAAHPFGFAIIIVFPTLFFLYELVVAHRRKRERNISLAKKQTLGEKSKQARKIQDERLERKRLQLDVTHRFVRSPKQTNTPDQPDGDNH